MSVGAKKKGMIESKLNYIGICPFFTHCWNEGLKLHTTYNSPECSSQYLEFRQSQANRQSIHESLSHQSNNMDRRVKNEAHNRLGKHGYDQNWVDHDDEEEYVWQEGQ